MIRYINTQYTICNLPLVANYYMFAKSTDIYFVVGRITDPTAILITEKPEKSWPVVSDNDVRQFLRWVFGHNVTVTSDD